MAKPTKAYHPKRPLAWTAGTAAGDALAIIAAFYTAYVLRFESNILPLNEPTLYAIKFHAVTPYLLVPLWLFIYSAYRLYDWRSVQRISSELSRIINASTLGVLLILIVSFLGKDTSLSRVWLALAWVIVIIYVSALRAIIRNLSRWLRQRAGTSTRLLIVGANEEGVSIAEQVKRFPQLGYAIIGFIDDFKKKGENIAEDFPVLGKPQALKKIIKEQHIDSVVFISSAFTHMQVFELLQSLEEVNIDTQMSAGLFEMVTDRLDLRDVGGIPMLGLTQVSLKGLNLVAKRVFDLIVSVLTLVIASPVMVLAAIGIKLTSTGPVMYKQQRVGHDNRIFSILKFRTMRVDAEKETGPIWTAKNDPRRTRLGAFLRQFSIDELPQLFNVIKGEMSLVGPRPERPMFVEDFDGQVPRYMERHRIKPGITGWAQVNGFRGNTSLAERVKFDNFYIENWSMLLDLEIILRTLIKVFREENAY